MTTKTEFSCDLNATTSPLPHVWEHTIGSGHATLALRADYQQQPARCRRELGFQYVRFHGILSDDVGTLVCEQDEPVYSFFNADQIIDFLRSIGMRPFVELSFMPTTLASGGDEVFHYRGNITPPKDYGAWATLIKKLVAHWVDRYGVAEVRAWFFEVWNEPNLPAFWTGTQKAYFKLYEHTARAIKSIDTGLQVGGPATAANAWIPELVAFCKHGDVPLDFVSTHHYPTDAFGKPGDDTVAQLAASERGVLLKEAETARKQAHGTPLYYTEWSTSSNPFDDLHDQAYAAAFILTVAGYFDGDDPREQKLRGLADMLYRRVDWVWACNDTAVHRPRLVSPEHGFLEATWSEGYCEALLLYVLALGSPTFPIDAAGYQKWTATFEPPAVQARRLRPY